MNPDLTDSSLDHTVLKDPSQSPKVWSRDRYLRLLHGVGPAGPQPQSLMSLPHAAHLAHEHHRLPELGLADGTDVTSLCALLSSGPDSVTLFAGGERDKRSCGPLLQRCPEKHDEISFQLLAPRSCDFGQDHMKLTHLRGAKKLQGFPNATHAATDVERLKGEQVDG